VAIVTFGPVQVHCDFTSAAQFASRELQASGDTPMGEAITHGLELLRARKKVYKAHGNFVLPSLDLPDYRWQPNGLVEQRRTGNS